MFRDLKLGGYNLEITQVSDRRLISIVILITLAYSISTFLGQSIKKKGVAKYVTRPTEPKRFYRRHSSFAIGLHGQNWIESNTFFQDAVRELIRFSTAKNDYYRRGMRAKILIQQAF
jgi:response regulator RpfG family c-di-GMP phosphodiesterase